MFYAVKSLLILPLVLKIVWMEQDWKARTRLLIGEEALEKLAKSHVLVAGLVRGRQRPATASGVTFITLEDYLKLDWPDARLVYFVNLFRQRAGLADRLPTRLRISRASASSRSRATRCSRSGPTARRFRWPAPAGLVSPPS